MYFSKYIFPYLQSIYIVYNNLCKSSNKVHLEKSLSGKNLVFFFNVQRSCSHPKLITKILGPSIQIYPTDIPCTLIIVVVQINGK